MVIRGMFALKRILRNLKPKKRKRQEVSCVKVEEKPGKKKDVKKTAKSTSQAEPK